MKKSISRLALIGATIMALAACQPQLPQVPQMIGDQQQQAPQQDSGIDGSSAVLGAVGGAAAGYMLGKAGQQNRTIIVERDRPGYGYRPYYNRGRSTVTTTTVKRSGLTGRTVTRTTTRRSR